MASSSSTPPPPPSSSSVLSAKARPFVPYPALSSQTPSTILPPKAPTFAQPSSSPSPTAPMIDFMAEFPCCDGDDLLDFGLLGLNDFVPLPSQGVPCTMSGASSGDASSRIYMPSCGMKSWNASYSTSSNFCAALTYTCSANIMACHPPDTNSILAQVYSQGSLSAPVDRVQSLCKESMASQIAWEKGFDGEINENNKINLESTATDSFIANKGLRSSSGIEYSFSMPIKLSKPLISESHSGKQDKSMENSAEELEGLDSDVDSPCWKGTLALQKPSLHVEAPIPHLTAVSSAGSVHVAGGGNSQNLTSDNTKQLLSKSSSGKSSDVALSSVVKRSDYLDTGELEGTCKGIQREDISKEHILDMRKDEYWNAEALGKEVSPSDQIAIVTSDYQPITANDVTNLDSCLKDAAQRTSSNSQCCYVNNVSSSVGESHNSAALSCEPSSSEEHAHLIDETLQCLRGGLLSYAHKDTNLLKKLLSDILKLVNGYPDVFVLKSSQARMMTAMDHAVGRSTFSVGHDKDSRTAQESCSSSNNEFGSISSNLEGMADEYEKILKKNFLGPEENPSTLLHKNLWIEAQVNLLKTKYELQLARVQIELLKNGEHAQGSLQDATRFPNLNSSQSYQVSETIDWRRR